jgi:hypothetical protein
VVDGNLSVFAKGVDVWDSNTGSWCSLQSFAMNGNNYMATGELSSNQRNFNTADAFSNFSSWWWQPS